MALGGDFRRLWTAYAASEAGSGIAFGALPLVAVVTLGVPEYQVSLMAALAGLAAAALALPAGPFIEFRRKRPIMVTADAVRFLSLLTVPAAMWLGVLSYWQLCLVTIAQTAGTIVFNAASGAHLKHLVDPADRPAATGRFEATTWTALSAGPPIGGVITTALGVGFTVAVDAASYLASAVGVRSIRSPEKPPPPRPAGVAPGRLAAITTGWRYIFAHRELRSLFLNAQIFGAAVMAGSPLVAVLMLRDLRFPAWQYGLAWGVACLGGLVGALLLKPLSGRYGVRPVLLFSGVFRAAFASFLAFLPGGIWGFALIVVVQFLPLVGSGIFNPAFATFRLSAVEDGYLSQVIACWSISSRTSQPIAILLGGVLAAFTSTRISLLILGVAALVSVVFLPWRYRGIAQVETPVATAAQP